MNPVKTGKMKIEQKDKEAIYKAFRVFLMDNGYTLRSFFKSNGMNYWTEYDRLRKWTKVDHVNELVKMVDKSKSLTRYRGRWVVK